MRRHASRSSMPSPGPRRNPLERGRGAARHAPRPVRDRRRGLERGRVVARPGQGLERPGAVGLPAVGLCRLRYTPWCRPCGHADSLHSLARGPVPCQGLERPGAVSPPAAGRRGAVWPGWLPAGAVVRRALHSAARTLQAEGAKSVQAGSLTRSNLPPEFCRCPRP